MSSVFFRLSHELLRHFDAHLTFATFSVLF
jgi:hypothetical protein